ncbi:hypothetical protein DPEC_G00291950 [Dallia pectoralis]|uniref:Uncharacterized protein n=1 Tax=Dallia pectoralis TaxID=75939 RepID=A0ACC2FHS3_DALPE|nr:hypothetical protein DPEC_G00291950 [Dallia pectoralis]
MTSLNYSADSGITGYICKHGLCKQWTRYSYSVSGGSLNPHRPNRPPSIRPQLIPAIFLRTKKTSNGCAKPPAVPGPIAVDPIQSLTPSDLLHSSAAHGGLALHGPSLAGISLLL